MPCLPPGLCGNFNQNQADDFRTLSGVVEGTAAAFANTWKTQAACPNVRNSFEDPCALSVENGTPPLGPICTGCPPSHPGPAGRGQGNPDVCLQAAGSGVSRVGCWDVSLDRVSCYPVSSAHTAVGEPKARAGSACGGQRLGRRCRGKRLLAAPRDSPLMPLLPELSLIHI